MGFLPRECVCCRLEQGSKRDSAGAGGSGVQSEWSHTYSVNEESP